MKRKIAAALLALTFAAGVQACAHAQSSDIEQLVDFVSPTKDAQAVALEVEGLKAWLGLNMRSSFRPPDFDQERLGSSFTEAVRAEDVDYRRALLAALNAADAGRREQALQFFRSADGQQVIANQRRYDDQVLAWVNTPEDKRAAAPPVYSPSEAEKAFATSEAVKILGAAMGEARAKTEQLPTVMERAASIYCANDACSEGHREMFRRMYASAHMSKARGEHAMWGKTAADIFPDEQQAALARAACGNDGDQVKQLVAAGANPNAVGDEGVMGGGMTYRITPLFWAMDCDAAGGVEALLAAGADPNLPVDGGRTAVMFAAEDKNPALLQAMLDHGGDPDAHDNRDSALMLAWRQQLPKDGARANWEALLAAGADVNLDLGGDGKFDRDVAGKAALFDDWEIVLELLNRGYSHDLGNLAALIQEVDVYPEPVRQAAKRQVIDILRSRGVLLPFGDFGKIDLDIGWIDYRSLNGAMARSTTGSATMVVESNFFPKEIRPPFNGKHFQLWYLADAKVFVEATNAAPVLRELTAEEISSRWGLTDGQLAAVRDSPSVWKSFSLP